MSQEERTFVREFTFIPESYAEFLQIINKAPIDILLGFGFLPSICGGQYVGLLLFPAEWYGIIPDGFIVTGIAGNTGPFKRGYTSQEKRNGCLSYGIIKK